MVSQIEPQIKHRTWKLLAADATLAVVTEIMAIAASVNIAHDAAIRGLAFIEGYL